MKKVINKKSIVTAIAAFGIAGLVAACGGGGGGGTTAGTGGGGGGDAEVAALELPSKLSLVKAEEDDGAAMLNARALSAKAFNDAGTDYANAKVMMWVDDESEGLDMINEVLGVMNETAYDQFVNKGPYKALVKPPGQQQQSQGGSSTSSQTTENLQEIIVDVTREDNDSPMIAKVWLVETDMQPPMLIKGYIEVEEGVSATYPYGKMKAYFQGAPQSGGSGEEFNMVMDIGANTDGEVTIQFLDEGSMGIYSWTHKANVIGNADMSVGRANISVDENGDTEQFYFAFDESYFKYQDSLGQTEALDKTAFDYKVYRYMLFDKADGSKVSLNSGIPFRIPDTDEYGYVGYYGLWAPHGVTIENGDTITDLDGNEYTVVKVAGKLAKHTAATIPLSELDGVNLSVWDDSVDPPQDLIIAWDSVDDSFKKIGMRNMENGQIEYFETPEDFTFTQEWQGGWCDSLRAYLSLGRLYWQGDQEVGPPTDDTVLKYHKEATVNPGTLSDDLTLWYYDWETAQDWVSYTFDHAESVLKLDGAAVLYDGQSSDLWINPLLLSETEPAIDPWEAHEEATFYSWQSGANEWNQFTSVKDADGIKQFDAPLQFAYAHDAANNARNAGDTSADGKKFNLEYDGFSLMIPWKFNDQDGDEGDWEPVLTLKDGVTLETGGTEYVIKAVEMEAEMRELANPADADTLEIDTDVPAPAVTFDSDKISLVAEMPTGVTLKVVKGEVK